MTQNICGLVASGRHSISESYSQSDLDRLLAAVPRRTGWNFSLMNVIRQQRPWVYGRVVRRYLNAAHIVLDIGTGDGAFFATLGNAFASGVGIDPDPEMIAIARAAPGAQNIDFRLGAADMHGISQAFDVIINRNAPLDYNAIAGHLEPGGYFITQQVGERNMMCVKHAIGHPLGSPVISRAAVEAGGLRLIALLEYNTEFVVCDIESLLFWLLALDVQHSDIDGARAIATAQDLNRVLDGHVDHRGFVTNEHRYLLVAQAGE
jgi:SAM-dependent methyltransferase